MTRRNATDVSRNFAAVLNRVASGEEVEVVRHGQVVARIAPARPVALSASAFRALVKGAPAVDADFAGDVAAPSRRPRIPGRPDRHGGTPLPRGAPGGPPCVRGAPDRGPGARARHHPGGACAHQLWPDHAPRGQVPGAHDLWIGATASAHGWPLETLDRKDCLGAPPSCAPRV